MRNAPFIALLAAASAAWASPPTDEQVAQAAARYNDRIKQMLADGSFNPGKLGPTADEAIAGLDISEMTAAQIASMMESTNLIYYTSKGGAFDDRLAALSAAPTVEGARAALCRLSLLGSADVDRQSKIMGAMLEHPKLAQVLEDKGSWGYFGALALGVEPKALKPHKARLIALGASMPESVSVHDAAIVGPALFDTVSAAGATPQEREPLRVRLIAVFRNARARFDPADPELKNISFGGVDAGQYLDQQVQRLQGPAGLGTLIGGPAPEIAFEWNSEGKPLKSLADLRGKVVVLDFWATWCGPCVASFPKMRDSAARYKGLNVEIIGVTSIQGHINQKGGKTIDCKGDPERERSLMGEYAKANDMTWTVVFSKEGVMNPSYGVRGIPAVFVIDPKGVVRHAGLSFHDSARLHEAIDALLKEAGMPAPKP